MSAPIGATSPDERWDERAAPTVVYLMMFKDSDACSPGFANQIQDVYREKRKDGRVRLFTYVIKEQAPVPRLEPPLRRSAAAG